MVDADGAVSSDELRGSGLAIDETIIDRVCATARATPHEIAVTNGETALTFAEIAEESAAVATSLLGQGVGPGSLVAISLGRHPRVVPAMLGVLRAGGMYTIVEDEVDDAGVDCTIVFGSSGARPGSGAGGVPSLSIDNLKARAVDAVALPRSTSDDAAYVLYTSGSSGRPKGVVVTHGNIRAYVLWVVERLGISRSMAYAHVSSLAADLGNTCLLLPLWTGGMIHLVDDMCRRDPTALWSYLATSRVDVLKITPSHWNAIRQGGEHERAQTPKLQFLVFGGEPLARSLAEQSLESGVTRCVVNHYGPTEATVGVCAHVVRSLDDLRDVQGDTLPIGRPFSGVDIRIRRPDRTLTKRAGDGELYLGGPSIARGYLADDAATAAAFVSIDENTRLYRTGDKVRLREDGILEFVGRTDRQFKVRGRRVEPEHIETVARTCLGLRDAMAVLVDAGTGRERMALAFVASPELSAARLDHHLRERLPAYMQPSRYYRFQDAFPFNSNGKRDSERVRELIDTGVVELCAHAAARPGAGRPDDDEPGSKIRSIWQRHLGNVEFDDDTDFFEVGGDSLDAIQVLSALTILGYEVPADVFLSDPTIRGLKSFIDAPTRQVSIPRDAGTVASGEHDELRPSQCWFFEQNFTNENHWNQAILLAVRDPVVAALHRALDEVIDRHPALRTAFVRPGGDGATRGATIADYFSQSTMPSGGRHERDDHVESVARRLHASIDIAAGRTFLAHLFVDETGSGLLLLIAHHLCVDLGSWRVLVSDLSTAYQAKDRMKRGDDAQKPASNDGSPPRVERVLSIADSPVSLVDRMPGLPASTLISRRASGNVEANAASLWFALSNTDTRALWRNVRARGATLHYSVLVAAVRALCTSMSADAVLVDIETHGRSRETLQSANVVGWLTLTAPVVIWSEPDFVRAAEAVAKSVDTSAADPRVGVVPSGAPAKLCYNFLGNVGSIADDGFALAPRQGMIGPARGDVNSRPHDLVLTARLIEARLVVELAFSDADEDVHQMRETMEQLKETLLDLAGTESESNILHQEGSTAGLLAHVPASLSITRASWRAEGYGKVLLTGATGHLGSYVLRDLLTKADAEIICLVRGLDDADAARRLRLSMGRYFGPALMDAYCARVRVVAGDVSAPEFGLPRETYASLSHEAEAVYHLAADTRLFGPPGDLRRVNTEGTALVVDFAETARNKDVHFASTLAVCGRLSNRVAREFSEHHHDIGQEFLNEYERSKFAAEQVLRAFADRGGTCSIYRTGNVSADSTSGLFRPDATYNRIVQFLRALVLVGGIPRDRARNIALSPVDVVSEAIVRLSLRDRSGVYHIDSPHVTTIDDIIRTLTDLGFEFRNCPDQTSGELLADHAADDPDIAVALFWEVRGERNVVIDNSTSDAVLSRMGIKFPKIDRAWLGRYLNALIADDALPHPGSFRPCLSNGGLRREGVST